LGAISAFGGLNNVRVARRLASVARRGRARVYTARRPRRSCPPHVSRAKAIPTDRSQAIPTDRSQAIRDEPGVAVDGTRRLPLPPLVEAGARLALGYARNQYGLRDKRPIGRFVTRTARFFAAGRKRRYVEADMGGLRVVVPTADRTIARSVYTAGDWDPLLVGAAFDALDAFGQHYRGTTFLEVGANFGVYALPAVTAFGFARAVAYEPDPASFRLLTHNIERNGLRGRVTAHHAALSAEPGELTLSLGTGNAGDNRIVDGSRTAPRRTTVQVPARTFDDEVASDRIPLADLGLVWLDVQGHEGEVLAGARTLLESDVPLLLEYCTWMLDETARHRLDDLIAGHFDVMVDLGWCSLTNRLRFQPASAVRDLAPDGRHLETDLLLLRKRQPGH
jgi:FkbM family methyltransferase